MAQPVAVVSKFMSDVGRAVTSVALASRSKRPRYVGPGDIPDQYMDPLYDVSIENVVCKSKLNVTSLNLSAIGAWLDAQYNPAKMPKVTIHYQDIPATILMFSTGSLVCIGSKSREKGYAAVCRLCDELSRVLGREVRPVHFVVCNLVASDHYPTRVVLPMLKRAYPSCCLYDPDLFPGARFLHHESSITFTVFGSGSVNFTGVNDRSRMKTAFLQMCRIIEACSVKRVGGALSACVTSRPKQVALMARVDRDAAFHTQSLALAHHRVVDLIGGVSATTLGVPVACDVRQARSSRDCSDV